MKSRSSANSTISSKRCVNLALRQPEHDAVDEDVLAAGDLRVEAGAELDQRRDAAVHRHGAARRLGDAGDQLQRVLLPDPLRPMTPQRRPVGDVERHVVQRRERLVGLQVSQDAALQQRALQRRELRGRRSGGRSSRRCVSSIAGVPCLHRLRERIAQPIEEPVAGQEQHDRRRAERRAATSSARTGPWKNRISWYETARWVNGLRLNSHCELRRRCPPGTE